MREPATLGQLATLVSGELRGDAGVRILDVTHDSRAVTAGSLFVAIRGFTVDGHRFIPRLVGRAAGAAVEEWVAAEIAQLRVVDTRLALGPLAAAVHDHPSQSMSVVGVTGTNGKTTVTHFMEAIIQAGGRRAGRIGTTGASIDGVPAELERTTPEASDLHRLFARMVSAGVEITAMEVSSHALELGRVGGVAFAVAAFTNLSQDHLDFHHDMEDYFEAKARLFDGRARHEVIWVDDDFGRRLYRRGGERAMSVGMGDADITASNVRPGLHGSEFELHTPAGSTHVVVPLGGSFNVANAMVAAACALAAGLDLRAVANGLATIPPIPGRMEPVVGGQPFSVLVDYAHSPGGLETVVRETAAITEGRVIVVVGAGGDRDQHKRPLMGAAAAAGDLLIVTSDNPRSEDPEQIIDEVIAGTREGPATVLREADRRTAISDAITAASPGDVVLILGKGHEQGQEFRNGDVEPFDDRAVAREVLADVGYRP